jgi:hypothetical protein
MLQNLVTRSTKVTAALLLDECRPLLEALFLSPCRAGGAAPLRVAAVGGGPGFESIGLAGVLVCALFLLVMLGLLCEL